MIRFDTLLLDLDDTLYSPSNGLWEQVRFLIGEYMIQSVGIPPENVDSTRQHYLETYGTTLQGLIRHHAIDPLDYLEYVHPVSLEAYIKPDPVLAAMLSSLPQRKIIFTNSYRKHAERVVDTLGIGKYIDSIVDILALDLDNKPQPIAYTKLLKLAEIKDPVKCLFADDRPANLAPASELGITTVLVSSESLNTGGDYHIQHIHQLDQLIPGLRS
ncbi:MAG: pyrimidine 5'-nucleotidase [Anaerolineales bacterium]|nr:pyrimidine 5'-nucleotidase [Anaerolineales bacterium]